MGYIYQFLVNKQLIIKNLPINVTKASINNELQEIKFEVTTVTSH